MGAHHADAPAHGLSAEDLPSGGELKDHRVAGDPPCDVHAVASKVGTNVGTRPALRVEQAALAYTDAVEPAPRPLRLRRPVPRQAASFPGGLMRPTAGGRRGSPAPLHVLQLFGDLEPGG